MPISLNKYLIFSTLLFSLNGYAQPIANFSANHTQGCAPLLVQFTSLSTNSPTTYLWDFGNGNTSTLQNPSASYVVAGKFAVKLTVSNSLGSNTKTLVDYITVYPLPSVAFGTNPNKGCAPLLVSFQDSSSSPLSSIVSWAWDFGDGAISTSKNPNNTYYASNSFSVSLQVTDGNGCRNSLIKNNLVLVQTKPTLDFKASSFFGCGLPFSTPFTPLVSPAGTYSYKWDFGNGTQSTLSNPTANYSTKGNYSVSLQVVTSAQCTVSLVKPAYIKIADVVPNFNISGTPDLCAPGNVSIINTTNFDTFGIVYEWYLNGVLVSNFKHPKLTNLPIGTYSLELKVKIGSCVVSALKSSFFSVQASSKSNFDADKWFFCKAPATVHFRDSSTNATSWNWDFGNGQTSNQKNPSNIYTQNGNYTVRLITSHVNGCKDTMVKTAYIKINPGSIIPVIIPKYGCVPLPVTFSVTDTNFSRFTNFTWNFGKAGAGANTSVAYHTYNDTGTYVITLTATNAEGCYSQQHDTLIVGMHVTPDFFAEKRVYCYSEQPIIFTNTTTSNVPNLSFKYVYGDTSDILWEAGNKVFFKDTGTFNIGLLAIHNGCSTNFSRANYIRVMGPIAEFKTSYFGCSKSQIQIQNTSKGGNKFIWDFGDGSSKVGQVTSHNYDSSGTFLLTLTAIDTITGCTSVYTLPQTILRGVTPNFTISSKVGCMPLTAILTNTTEPLSDFIHCRFEVGSDVYTGNVVSALLYNPGKYTVKMILTDKLNCVYSITKEDSILVNGAYLKYTSTPEFGCSPLLMHVRDSSKADLPISKRIWYWGTGDSTVYTHKDSINSRYVYQQPPAYQNGGYTLKLVIEDSMGCRFFMNRKLYISRPKPDFTVTQLRTCLADTFIFKPIADDLIGLTPVSFYWKINNEVSSSRILKKLYYGDTSVLVKLIASDVYGCIDSMVKTVKIITGPPKIDFDAMPKKINCPGPPIYFTDYSTPGSTPIKEWKWEFGDGGISNLQNPTRIYLLPGTYSVMLTLTDSIGCTSSKTIPDMVVIGGPDGNYALFPNFGCAPLKVEFGALATNVVKYEWDMGDGTIDTNANTFHTYTRPGRYIPNLTLTDSAGCKIGLPPIDSIEVLANPQVDFFVSKKKNCLGASVSLTGEVIHSSPIQIYKWSIDGNTFSTLGPHVYNCNRVGDIPVMFEVTDDQGCIGKKFDSLAISVFKDSLAPNQPFAYRASVETDEAVSFNFSENKESDLDFYLIHYDWNGSAFNQTRTLSDIQDTVQFFENLSTRYFTYSYQMQAVDVCNNYSLPSKTHTTMELKAKGLVNAIQLDWSPYLGWDSVTNYTIFRLNDESKQFDKIGKIGGEILSFVDTQVYCHKISTYKVMASFQGIVSFSDTAAAIPLFLATTPQTRTVRATVENNKNVLVQWYKRTHKFPYNFVIEKSSSDPKHGFEQIVLGENDTFYIDKNVDVQKYSYQYVVYIEDACGGLGEPSNMAKTILLNLDVEKNDKLLENPVLSWNPYQEWASGIERYELYFKNDSLGINELIATKYSGDTLASKHEYLSYDQDDYCYQVVAYQKDSNWIMSWSNIACMNTAPRMYAPNAFTCNQDKLNDGFLIQGVFVKKFELQIFNRWGETVYETDDMNAAWDGNYNGAPAPSDVYVYIATGYGRKGKFTTIKGNVTLLR
ncbi:MAG: PKD domain-containing protein [Bacteroidia bacterium]|nr:PKD domain-containing protein [Bacteroidia bacterium]